MFYSNSLKFRKETIFEAILLSKIWWFSTEVYCINLSKYADCWSNLDYNIVCSVFYLSLESFCKMMLSFSSSLLSWLGARSTIAIVLNQVSLLHVSKKGCWNGESVDICRKMSIADPMKVCKSIRDNIQPCQGHILPKDREQFLQELSFTNKTVVML